MLIDKHRGKIRDKLESLYIKCDGKGKGVSKGKLPATDQPHATKMSMNAHTSLSNVSPLEYTGFSQGGGFEPENVGLASGFEPNEEVDGPYDDGDDGYEDYQRNYQFPPRRGRGRGRGRGYRGQSYDRRFDDYDDVYEEDYSTDNQPVVLGEDLLSTLINTKYAVVDIDELCSGKVDRKFYSSKVRFIKEDIRTPKKFDGKDVTYWPEFIEYVHMNINTKRYLNWPDKLANLKAWLDPPALDSVAHQCSPSRDGYLLAIRMLHKKFGQFCNHEEALLLKMSRLDAVDIKDMHTLNEALNTAQALVVYLVRKGINPRSHQTAIFAALKWDARTKDKYYDFAEQKSVYAVELNTFQKWVESRERRQFEEQGVKHLSKKKQGEVTLVTQQAASSESSDTYESAGSGSGSEPYHTTLVTEEGKCANCKSNTHELVKCFKFQKLKIGARRAAVRSARLCYICLTPGHRASDCDKKGAKCKKCDSEEHHTLVHPEENQIKDSPKERKGKDKQKGRLAYLLTQALKHLEDQPEDKSKQHTVNAVSGEDELNVLFRVVPVWIALNDSSKERVKVNMALDDTSSTTFVSKWLGRRLGMKGEKSVQEIKVMGSRVRDVVREGQVCLQSIDGAVKITTKATQWNIPDSLKPPPLEALRKRFPFMKNIPFHQAANREGVDILLGLDNFNCHRSVKEHDSKQDEPYCRETVWGNTLVYHPKGAEPQATVAFVDQALSLTEQDRDERWENLIRSSYELETLGIHPKEELKNPALSLAEENAKRKVLDSLRRTPEGNYEAAVAWSKNPEFFPRNAHLAEKITTAMLGKITRDPKVNEKIVEQLQKWEQEGFIKEIPRSEIENGRYMSWFTVVKWEKSTPVRLVFNCAQKFGSKPQVSLNDFMYKGEKLHNDIIDVIIGLRRYPVAVGTDISKMYHRFAIAEEDRKYHRFFYEGKIYEFQVWFFGSKCAPFIALLITNEHVKNCDFEDVKRVVKECLYMDDVLTSVLDEEEAIELVKNMFTVFDDARLPLGKFVTNNSKVWDVIPEERKGKALSLMQQEGHSALGVKWLPVSDDFTFENKSPDVTSISRADVSQLPAEIYDPLNVLAPFTVRALECVQDLAPLARVLGFNWRQDLTKLQNPDLQEVLSRFKVFAEETRRLSLVRFKRVLIKRKPKNLQLHTFVDGSMKAYAAATYLRVEYDDGEIDCNLVIARKRLNPLARRSIPETELMGAEIGAALSKRAMKLFPEAQSHLWSDSTCVISWISKPARCHKPFVSGRVREIHDLVTIDQWHYVSTKNNPADFPTRGMSIDALAVNDMWWKGPKFLRQKIEKWPKFQIKTTDEDLWAMRAHTAVVTTRSMTRRSEEEGHRTKARLEVDSEGVLVSSNDPACEEAEDQSWAARQAQKREEARKMFPTERVTLSWKKTLKLITVLLTKKSRVEGSGSEPYAMAWIANVSSSQTRRWAGLQQMEAGLLSSSEQCVLRCQWFVESEGEIGSSGKHPL